MAESTFPTQTANYALAEAKGSTTNGAFVPKMWADEIIANYQQSLRLSPLVRKMSVKGKKGDTVIVPKPQRGEANAKVAKTAVTLQSFDAEELVITLDRHFEFSTLFEDIVDVQANSSLRRFTTEDAGYQLARQTDNDLFSCGTAFATDGASNTRVLYESLVPASWANSGTYFNDAGAGALTQFTEDTMLAADVFTDAFFRNAIQQLDDNDVPMGDRCFVIPPVLVNTMRGIDEYINSDYRDDRVIRSGEIGSLYGVKIVVSTNCPTLETAAQNGAASGVASRGAFLMHKDAIVHAEQMAVRTQTQYKQEFLGTLFTADTLYGIQTYRPENGIVLAVPA